MSVQIPPTSIWKSDGTDCDRQALRALLLEFEDVFAWDEYYPGRTNRIQHAIETGAAKPIWQPPRRIPVQYQNEVRDLLDSMLATGAEVEPIDRQKAAFILPQELFDFKTMPFGLCYEAATFQRLMQVVLAHLCPQQCLLYPDDVVVFGRTIEQHNQDLYAELEACREAGLRLSSQKCQVLRHQVFYLGHEVSAAGIRVAPEKIDAIRPWPTP
nr:unnamed protein product [Spirometra erinaceieuropaei]